MIPRTSSISSPSTADAPKLPLFLKYRSSNWFITTTICLAVFTDIFLYGLVVPVLPAVLNQRAGISSNQIQIWISILLAAYGGALFLLSPICGYLADRTTHRRIPFLVGLIILTTGTVLLCIGSSIGLFIAGRILQGASGAVVWIVGMAILVDTVGSENIAHYMGFVSTAMSLGILCGPLLGGVIYDAGGYYAVFGLAFGILGLDIVLRIVMVEKKVAKGYEESQSIDLEDHGSTRCPPVSQNPNEAQSAPGSEDPRKPTRKFKVPPTISMLASRRLLVALFSTIVVAIIATGFDAVLPLFTRTTFGWNTIGGGLIFLPLFIPSLISYHAGKLADKYGARYVATVGFLVMVPPLVLLREVNSESINQEVLLCALLAIVGIGLALNLPSIMAEIIYIVDTKAKDESDQLVNSAGATAQAYGLFNGAFALGTLVGPIWTGYLTRNAGFGTMGWTLALLSGITAVPVFIVMGGKRITR